MSDHDLAALLERDTFLIGGEWVRPHEGGHIEVVCPSTEEVVGRAPLATAVDVDRAVAAARRALDESWWPGAEPEARIEVLERAWALLEPQLGPVARLVTTEMGAPIRWSELGIGHGSLPVGRLATDAARSHQMQERIDAKVPAVVVREPVGVVAAIAPWNGPFQQAVYKLAYPLAAGCPVVFKPAPETPLDVWPVVEALVEAGVPEGVLSVLPGGREAGQALVAHPDVAKVSFTGSASVGREIGAVCGRRLAHAALELGGKSAAIVLDDADLDAASPHLAAGIFGNAGQVCAATSRLLVARSRHDEVVERMVAAAEGIVVGDPFGHATDMGPLVSRRQRDRVESYLAAGRESGARLVTGGGRPQHLRRGWYVEPTIFDHVDNDSTIAQEEIFGPVLVITTFEDEDHAVALANASRYGLNGSVYTADDERGFELARRVRTGTISVNGYCINMEAPFGGVGDSGLGRKFGPHGLESFFELKTINLLGASR